MVLAGKPDRTLAVLGVECSTYVSINRGTSKRDELNPCGDTSVRSVRLANQATSRHIQR